MKILYDHQIFTIQKYGGISRYFYELLKAYKNEASVETLLSLKYSNNHYLLDNKIIKNFAAMPTSDKFLYGVKFKGKAKLFRFCKALRLIENSELMNKKNSIQLIKSREYDLFHPTYYDTYFLDYIDKRPFVLTVYDMIHELFSNKFHKYKDSTIKTKRVLLNKANAIIAISENTKKDIVRLYGIDEKKIHVVYLGSSLKNTESHVEISLPERYILYIGDRWDYKNYEIFLKSIIPLLKKDKDLYLICGGSNPFNKKDIKYCKNFGCEDRVLHINIYNDVILKNLYKHAIAFIFPSLYEGFGIPILESFSCGCPVILSNSSSFPEVAGDAGVYFNPEDELSIRKAIESVIYDDNLREEMKKKGYKQLSKFSWEKTALQTKKVYESLL